MSSCTECHGMAGQKYDDHTSNNCPRFAQSNQDRQELEKFSSQEQAIEEWMESLGFRLNHSGLFYDGLNPDVCTLSIGVNEALFFYTICQKAEREAVMHGKGVLATEMLDRIPSSNLDSEVLDRLEYLRDTFAEPKSAQLVPSQDTTKQEEES